MHILLLLSIVLTVVSSYFLTLLCENKKVYTAVCCFSAIAFAQVVFIYQILSVFSAIEPVNVVGGNVLFFIISSILFVKQHIQTDFKEDCLSEYEKIKFAVKNDKWLKYTAVAFLIFMAGTLIFAYMMPANDEDAFSYHIARLPFWYAAKNLAHFECADVRNLIMPINSEIFYFWAYSFVKSSIFVRFFSLFSYILFAVGLRGFLRELNIPVKISLWVIFTVTAMQNVMFAISGTETNISVAALFISAVYLFTSAVKNNNNKVNLFFSALLYALAIGVKTPSLQAAPTLLLIASVIAFVYQKNKFYKPLLLCAAFIVINFIFFASYNYYLNYIDFGNPLTSSHAAEVHRFYGGFKGFIANIVKYLATFIDFSGFPFAVNIWRIKIGITSLILALFGIPFDIGTITSETKYFSIGNNFENMCGLGILGFLVFLPSVFVALKRLKHSKRSLILGAFAIGFILNLLILSVSLGYMIFSIRFIMFFVMFASPVIAHLFMKKKRNIFTKIVAVIIIYSLTFSYYFYERRFSPYLLYIFYKNPSVSKFKQKIECANIDFDTESEACKVTKILKRDKPVKVIYFAPEGTNIYFAKKAEDKNFTVDFRLLETFDEKDLDKYDYVVVPNVQENTNIKDVLKYKKAVTKFNDGSDGKGHYYDFSPEVFANCVFGSSRQYNFRWLSEDENKITTSNCYYKADILKKHGYKLMTKIDNYDKKPEKQLNVYKKTN